MQRLLLETCVGLALALACYILWDRYEAASDRADKAETALKTEKANEHAVTKFVDRVVQVPGPERIRERLVRGVCHVIDLPSAGDPAARPAADALVVGGDEAGAAAQSLRNAAINEEQLKALLEVVRPQVKTPGY